MIDDQRKLVLKGMTVCKENSNNYNFYKNFHLRSGIVFRLYITKVNDLKSFVFYRISPNILSYRHNRSRFIGMTRTTSAIDWNSILLYCNSWTKLKRYLPDLKNIWKNLVFFIKLKFSVCRIHNYTYTHFIRLIINYFMDLKNVLSNDYTDHLNFNTLDSCIYKSRIGYKLKVSWKVSNFISSKKVSLC